MLFTRCILFDPLSDEGIRISVMSRHTLNDGKTPDPRIKNFAIHAPILGPSPRLIGDYYRRGLPWEEFEQRFLAEMREGYVAMILDNLAQFALSHNVTLMCIEETAERCHRRLLAEECQRLSPTLVAEHR